MQWIDPIVEEVRSAREKIWKECNYDLNTLFEFLKEKEKLHNQRVITEKIKTKEIIMKNP